MQFLVSIKSASLFGFMIHEPKTEYIFLLSSTNTVTVAIISRIQIQQMNLKIFLVVLMLELVVRVVQENMDPMMKRAKVK